MTLLEEEEISAIVKKTLSSGLPLTNAPGPSEVSAEEGFSGLSLLYLDARGDLFIKDQQNQPMLWDGDSVTIGPTSGEHLALGASAITFKKDTAELLTLSVDSAKQVISFGQTVDSQQAWDIIKPNNDRSIYFRPAAASNGTDEFYITDYSATVKQFRTQQIRSGGSFDTTFHSFNVGNSSGSSGESLVNNLVIGGVYLNITDNQTKDLFKITLDDEEFLTGTITYISWRTDSNVTDVKRVFNIFVGHEGGSPYPTEPTPTNTGVDYGVIELMDYQIGKGNDVGTSELYWSESSKVFTFEAVRDFTTPSGPTYSVCYKADLITNADPSTLVNLLNDS